MRRRRTCNTNTLLSDEDVSSFNDTHYDSTAGLKNLYSCEISQCVYARFGGTAGVCICTVHLNVTLMNEVARIATVLITYRGVCS